MRDFVVPEAERPVAPGPAPSFSIVIAAYQAAAFIGDAVELGVCADPSSA